MLLPNLERIAKTPSILTSSFSGAKMTNGLLGKLATISSLRVAMLTPKSPLLPFHRLHRPSSMLIPGSRACTRTTKRSRMHSVSSIASLLQIKYTRGLSRSFETMIKDETCRLLSYYSTSPSPESDQLKMSVNLLTLTLFYHISVPSRNGDSGRFTGLLEPTKERHPSNEGQGMIMEASQRSRGRMSFC